MKKHLKGDDILYLVIDPADGEEDIVPKLIRAIQGGVDVVQIWDHWNGVQNKEKLVEKICTAVSNYNIPVIINNNHELLSKFPLDGIHLDIPSPFLDEIKASVDREFFIGVTCGNNLDVVRWAEANRLSYISFCSMFPSQSADACDIVSIEIVKHARRITAMPIFLAGGITQNNLESLNETGMNGVALISAIMKNDNVFIAASDFKNQLRKMRHEKKPY